MNEVFSYFWVTLFLNINYVASNLNLTLLLQGPYEAGHLEKWGDQVIHSVSDVNDIELVNKII
jgi:hypothetical protein